MAWLAQYGVDVVAVEWNGEVFDLNNFQDTVLPEIVAHNRSYVVLYDLLIRFRGVGRDFGNSIVRERFVDDMVAFATDSRYFAHPNYLKLNNKPAVYLYISRDISSTNQEDEGPCQGPSCIQLAFDQARGAAQGAGFSDLYIVADHLWWVPDYSTLPLMGAQAATSFAPLVQANHPGCPSCPDVPQGQAGRPVRQWADHIAGLYTNAKPWLSVGGLVDVTPGVFVQFDNYGTDAPAEELQRYHLLDVTDWSYMLQTAGLNQRWIAQETTIEDDCSRTRRTNTDYTSILWIYSFNEWGEGSGLEPLDARSPAYPYGFGLEPLQTFAGVVGSSSQPPTQPPTAPVLRNPLGATDSLRPTFSWDGVQSAVSYELKVWNGSQLVISDGTLDPETTYTPASDFAEGTTYTWRVRARNPVGWGPFSQLAAFTTPSGPPLPQCGPFPADPLQFYKQSTLPTPFPCRVLDTRITGPRLQHNTVYSFPMTGSCGIPGTAKAVSVVLTSVTPTSEGHLRTSAGCMMGSSGFVSGAATLNFEAGATRYARDNNAILPLSSMGTIAVQPVFGSSGSVDLVMDVTGYFAPPDGTSVGNDYTPLPSPMRLIDTRNPAGPLGGPALVGGVARDFFAQGNLGIPGNGARALVGNATVVGPAVAGHLRLFPSLDSLPPIYSNLNYVAGETVGNGGIIAVSSLRRNRHSPPPAGDLKVWSSASTNLIYDVMGYFNVGPSYRFRVATPCRLIDTRNPAGPYGGPSLVAGAQRSFIAGGQCGVPSSAKAVSVNVTVLQPSAVGNLRVFPSGISPVPTVSNLNYSANQTLGNATIVALDASGAFTIYCAQATGTAHVIVDVSGYFQ
jgi:hypothetical protein